MSFNIGQALIHGAESFVMSGGNPIAAGIGAVAGGLEPEAQQSAAAEQPYVSSSINRLADFAKSDYSIIGGDL